MFIESMRMPGKGTVHLTGLLCKFRDSQSDFSTRFAESLNGPDASAPARLAHTLRGTAGNVGAGALAMAAATLEEICRNGRSSAGMSAALSAVERELAPVLEGLRAVQAPTDRRAGESLAPLAQELVAPLVERLKQRLAASDASSLELLAELGLLLGDQPVLRTRFDQLARKVHDFDFDAALILLQTTAFVT
jgi:two-component system sensor histidine kinase/response regulator